MQIEPVKPVVKMHQLSRTIRCEAKHDLGDDICASKVGHVDQIQSEEKQNVVMAVKAEDCMTSDHKANAARPDETEQPSGPTQLKTADYFDHSFLN